MTATQWAGAELDRPCTACGAPYADHTTPEDDAGLVLCPTCDECGHSAPHHTTVLGPDYTEADRPACPVCDELAGSCDHAEAETLYRAFRQPDCWAEFACAECRRERLEYLRGEIEAERISMGEIAELQGLAEYIEPGDVLLLEWAGVPELRPDKREVTP